MINSKAPASFFFSLGLGLILSLFVSIQLPPPASRVRLAAIVDAMVGMTFTDRMFFRLRFVIFMFISSPSNLYFPPRFSLALGAESERYTEFLVEEIRIFLPKVEDKVS